MTATTRAAVCYAVCATVLVLAAAWSRERERPRRATVCAILSGLCVLVAVLCAAAPTGLAGCGR